MRMPLILSMKVMTLKLLPVSDFFDVVPQPLLLAASTHKDTCVIQSVPPLGLRGLSGKMPMERSSRILSHGSFLLLQHAIHYIQNKVTCFIVCKNPAAIPTGKVWQTQWVLLRP